MADPKHDWLPEGYNDHIEVERLLATAVTFHTRQLIDRNVITYMGGVGNAVRYTAEHMVLELYKTVIAGESHEEEQIISWLDVPIDWWQHFKRDWFPDWLSKLCPVRYFQHTTTQIKRYQICPHINIPDQRQHIEFLFQKGGHE